MAVFQGARLRSVALPAEAVARRGRPSSPPSVHGLGRVRPVGLLMAAILTATMLGLAYLTQTLGSNASSSQISDLAAEANKLNASLRTQSWTVELYTDPDDVAKRARKQGLRSLGKPDVLRFP